MKYQEEVAKKNAIQEKKYNNMMRLAAIRKQQNITVTKATLPITKVSIASSSNIHSTQTPVQIKQNATPIIIDSIPSNIPGVDMNRVADSWFGWYNTYRSSLRLTPYIHDSRLDRTAHDWNIVFSASK